MPVARLAVGVAARLLPTPADRRRYRAEFVAELHGLPSAGQLRYAAGVLSQTLALRAALGRSPARLEEAAMHPRFRCRVLRWHHWKTYRGPQAARFRVCTPCAREQGPFYSPYPITGS